MRLPLLSLAALSFPVTALAATEAGHGDHGGLTLDALFGSIDFWGAVVNSLLLFAILYFAGRKKIAKAMEERREGVAAQLEEAKRLREAAEKRHQEYAKRLSELDAELAELRASIVKSGEVERERLVSDAEAKAARMREEAGTLIESRLKQLEKDLHHEVVVAAVQAAQQELERKTTAEDQTRLATEYLSTVRNAGGALGKETLS